MASVLVAIKGYGAWTTGSTAMLGSLADTALDLVASVATLAGVWVAGQPADDNHRFGHGKAEALSALFQVMLIGVSAVAWRFTRCSNSSRATHRAAGDGIIVSRWRLSARWPCWRGSGM
jgi:ferrous-iron efflux pump FieF